jgi:predicted DNA-binding transcriptional regulator YafY
MRSRYTVRNSDWAHFVTSTRKTKLRAARRRSQALALTLRTRGKPELLYWKLEAPAPTPKRLQPLHLLCVDSAWYLFAVDPTTPGAAPRTYLLSRMSELRRTGKRFRRPKDFHPDDLLAHSIGIYGGEEPQRLHLRLGPRAARWFGERRFHATQQFTSQPDGTAELTMEVAINPELERLILSWGSQIEVLAPAALRESIWRSAKAVFERQPEV